MTLVEQVHELFLLDQQVRGLRTRLDAAIRRQGMQQKKLEQLQQQLRELAEQHRQSQVKSLGLENQAKDADAKVAKFREQMNTVRNNKEYSALLIEVNTLKNEKAKLEEQALEQMTKTDALAADVAAMTAKVDEQRKLVTAAEGEVTAARSEVGQQLDEVTKRRDAKSAELPDQARTLFQKCAHMHEGEAMAPVVEESRRHMEYSCGGCYMSIPVERLNTLLGAGNTLVQCTNCNRILWVEQELRQALAPSK